MSEPIKMLTPNHYWEQERGIFKQYMGEKGVMRPADCPACKTGSCGGGVLRFPGKRATMGSRGTFRHKQPHENKGGVGKRARRKTRRYANPKLSRLNRR